MISKKLLNVVDVISELKEKYYSKTNIHPYGLVCSYDKFEAISMADGTYVTQPSMSLLEFQYLYRGERRIYPHSKPSLYRNVDINDNFELAHRLLKKEEFISLIKNHSSIHEYIENFTMYGNRPRIDFDALAQHYSLDTELLDFTSSLDIAAFFACTRFDAARDRYIPCGKSQGTGVIYKLDVISLAKDSDHWPSPDFKRVRPVCAQPIPRPAEQFGYVVSINKKEDIRDTMEAFEFRHDVGAARTIMNKVSNYNTVYVKNPLDQCVNDIKNMHSFTKSVFENTIKKYSDIFLPHVVIQLKEKFVFTEDSPRKLTEGEEKYLFECQEYQRKLYEGKVGVRLACNSM